MVRSLLTSSTDDGKIQKMFLYPFVCRRQCCCLETCIVVSFLSKVVDFASYKRADDSVSSSHRQRPSRRMRAPSPLVYQTSDYNSPPQPPTCHTSNQTPVPSSLWRHPSTASDLRSAPNLDEDHPRPLRRRWSFCSSPRGPPSLAQSSAVSAGCGWVPVLCGTRACRRRWMPIGA
jgi:hypothetical protein